ncbi:hypothetical protein V8E53_002998 [Lactarius tabidus]
MSPPPLTPSLPPCTIPSIIRSYRLFPSATQLSPAVQLRRPQGLFLARTQSEREQTAVDTEHFFDAFDKKVPIDFVLNLRGDLRLKIKVEGLTLRASGVHVRRDIGDESADVDIASTDGGVLISLPSAELSQSKIPSPRPTTRFRRPVPTRTPATAAKAKIRSETEKCTPPMLPPTAKKEKAKSETYK